MDSRQLSVLKTLSYSAVFNYPLSLDEIYYFLQTDVPVTVSELKKVVARMSKNSSSLIKKGGYYTFSDKEPSIDRRLRGKTISIKKISIARKIARVFMVIPSVVFIGISGAVGAGGAADEDDIDFFVITGRGSLYTTRFLLLIFLQLMGKRRRRNQAAVKDTICLNMLIDESSLMFAKDRQDLYTAREIAQIIPLFERNSMYASFLQANEWTQEFLPHATGKNGCRSLPQSLFPIMIFCILEPLLRAIQSLFIRRHSTSEVVSISFLAFHPNDIKKYIMPTYEKKLRHYIKCYTA